MPHSSIVRLLGLWLCVALPITSCAAISSQRLDAFEPTSAIHAGTPYPMGASSYELPVNPIGVRLNVLHQTQDVAYVPFFKSNLCWATSLAMVSTYLGNPRMPCQIASYKAGDGLSCCRLSMHSSPDDIERCNQGAFVNRYAAKMGLYFLDAQRPLTEKEIRLELSNGHPIIMDIRVVRKGPDGLVTEPYHAMVIVGYTSKTYHVLNPNRLAPDDLTYGQLLRGDRVLGPKPHGETWSWKRTWYHFSYRQDGCNPIFNPHCDPPEEGHDPFKLSP